MTADNDNADDQPPTAAAENDATTIPPRWRIIRFDQDEIQTALRTLGTFPDLSDVGRVLHQDFAFAQGRYTGLYRRAIWHFGLKVRPPTGACL
jgi:hypothetical protein